MEYLEEKFPSPSLHSDNILAEAATRDFFSKFCFFIKVGKRKSKLGLRCAKHNKDWVSLIQLE